MFCTVDIGEGHVYDAQFPHLAMIGINDYLTWLGLQALSLHHDIIKVLGTLGTRILLVPGIGHRPYPGQVASVSQRIEKQLTSKHLETCKITGRGIIAVLYDFHLDFSLVLLNQFVNHFVSLLNGIITIIGHSLDGLLQFCKLQT